MLILGFPCLLLCQPRWGAGGLHDLRAPVLSGPPYFPFWCAAYLCDKFVYKSRVFFPSWLGSISHPSCPFLLNRISAKSICSRGRPVKWLFHVLASLARSFNACFPSWLEAVGNLLRYLCEIHEMKPVTKFLSGVFPWKTVLAPILSLTCSTLLL